MAGDVRTKIDIVYSKNLDSSILQVFRFPFGAVKAMNNNVIIRNKVKQNRYEIEMALETDNPNFSKSRASNFTHALTDVQHVAKAIRHIRLSSRAVDDKNQFCVGVFKNGKLHITPVSGVIQLVPSYDHIDAIDKARRKKEKEAATGQKQDESSSQDESTDKPARKAQAITVKFGKNESLESKAKRKQTYPYLKEIRDEEPWLPLTFLNFTSAGDIITQLFLKQPNLSSKQLVHFSCKSYLNAILPSEDTATTKNVSIPYEPSSVLNVEDLKNMSILNKIIAILRNAFVVKYSQLITLLGNRAEKDNVVSCLKRVAVLVRGCWVINSEILYPEKSVSSACGISADLMRRGRDYILWRIEKHGFVMRKEMCSHTKLPGEEVRGILEAISQLNSETGWEFIYPVDTFFLDSNRSVRDEYIQFWYKKGQELCTELGLTFKHDVSPTRRQHIRMRNVSTDSSGGGGGSPSPGGEKRRRRRNSSKTGATRDDINAIIDKMDVETYRRTHSSPSESVAGSEKFLSEDEIKTMHNRMENYLLIKVSDFRPIISSIMGRTLNMAEFGKAARDLDFFEVPVKIEATKSSILLAYCARPPEFSDDERLLLRRCADMLTSKGCITKQSVPKLIQNINVDKTTVEKVLKQLSLLKDKKWVPRFLGVDYESQVNEYT